MCCALSVSGMLYRSLGFSQLWNIAPALAQPSTSVMRSDVPRFRTCDHVAPGWMTSSNKILLLSFPVQFFSEDDGLRELAHRAAQTPAFASQIEIRLLFGNAVAVLEDAFGAFDHLARFEGALHFQRFRNESRVFECEGGLAGDSFGESDFFIGEDVS